MFCFFIQVQLPLWSCSLLRIYLHCQSVDNLAFAVVYIGGYCRCVVGLLYPPVQSDIYSYICTTIFTGYWKNNEMIVFPC